MTTLHPAGLRTVIAAVAVAVGAAGVTGCAIGERPADQRPAVRVTPVPDPGATTLPASPSPGPGVSPS